MILRILMNTATMVVFLTACQSTPEHAQSWGPVAFETPVPFSAPDVVGLDAVNFVHPPENTLGEGRMELTLALASRDYVEALGTTDALLADMAGTFLGVTAATPGKARPFLGRTVEGWTARTSIPRPAHWEYHLVPLHDGRQLLVALRRLEDVPTTEATNVLDAIAETLRETGAGTPTNE